MVPVLGGPPPAPAKKKWFLPLVPLIDTGNTKARHSLAEQKTKRAAGTRSARSASPVRLSVRGNETGEPVLVPAEGHVPKEQDENGHA